MRIFNFKFCISVVNLPNTLIKIRVNYFTLANHLDIIYSKEMLAINQGPFCDVY